MNLRFRSYCGVTILFLSGLLFDPAWAEESAPQDVPGPIKLSSEGMDPERMAEARQITSDVASNFEKITHHRLGPVEIRIIFTEKLNLGEASHSPTGRIQGVTFREGESHVIQIFRRHTSSWGRILAHELAHVYVQETYGTTNNRILNEGLAEYLAAELFSSEVSKDFRNASLGSAALPPQLKVYADGFRFVAQRALDPRFAKFFELEIKGSKTSYRELAEAWKKTTESSAENAASQEP